MPNGWQVQIPTHWNRSLYDKSENWWGPFCYAKLQYTAIVNSIVTTIITTDCRCSGPGMSRITILLKAD